MEEGEEEREREKKKERKKERETEEERSSYHAGDVDGHFTATFRLASRGDKKRRKTRREKGYGEKFRT